MPATTDAPGPVRWSSRGRHVPRTGTRARSSPAGLTAPPTETGRESVSSRKDRHDRVYLPALGAAPVELAAHCHRVSLHRARRAEAARLSRPDDQPAGAVLADRPRGSARAGRRRAAARRAVHAAGRFHSLRRDGIRLFHGARRTGLLAPAQPRGAGRALLLRVPLSRRGGRRVLEPRPRLALALLIRERTLFSGNSCSRWLRQPEQEPMPERRLVRDRPRGRRRRPAARAARRPPPRLRRLQRDAADRALSRGPQRGAEDLL